MSRPCCRRRPRGDADRQPHRARPPDRAGRLARQLDAPCASPPGSVRVDCATATLPPAGPVPSRRAVRRSTSARTVSRHRSSVGQAQAKPGAANGAEGLPRCADADAARAAIPRRGGRRRGRNRRRHPVGCVVGVGVGVGVGGRARPVPCSRRSRCTVARRHLPGGPRAERKASRRGQAARRASIPLTVAARRVAVPLRASTASSASATEPLSGEATPHGSGRTRGDSTGGARIGLPCSSWSRSPRSRRPPPTAAAAARASRRPGADHLRAARRPVHGRLLRDVRGRGQGPAAARCAGAIVGMDARLVDARGNVIPQHVAMLHHLVFTNGGPDNAPRRPRVPVSTHPRALLRHQRGTAPAHAPARLRLPDQPGRPWRALLMVMHHRAGEREFFLEYRVTVDPRPVIPVKPYWLSVIPCVPDPQWSVPGDGTRPAPALARVHDARGGPDRRRRRPPARRRARARAQPAGLRRPHARALQAVLRAEGRPAVRGHAAAARARPEERSAGGSRRPAGRSARASG